MGTIATQSPADEVRDKRGVLITLGATVCYPVIRGRSTATLAIGVVSGFYPSGAVQVMRKTYDWSSRPESPRPVGTSEMVVLSNLAVA